MRAGDKGCKACDGGRIPCKGGGNLRCWKRNPQPARIAFILDTYGNVRTVVGTLDDIEFNARHDEIVRLVPRLIVHEPIAWNDIPFVIERARLEFVKWLETRPNLNEWQHECVTMYRLRCLEANQRSLDLNAIVET